MERQNRRKSKRRWFILLGAHVTMFVFGGTYRTFGVFLVAWREYFNSSAAEISAIMTILAASSLLSGFLSGPFITRYGCHNAILLGGSFIVAGSIVSAFAPSPLVLCLTAGLMWGIGIGFIKNAAQVIVALYFNKGYSRANGFTSAGVAMGIMVCPPILQLCIDQYGWRGTMFIFSGIQAHVIVAGLIARPPMATSPIRKRKSSCDCELRDTSGQEVALSNLKECETDSLHLKLPQIDREPNREGTESKCRTSHLCISEHKCDSSQMLPTASDLNYDMTNEDVDNSLISETHNKHDDILLESSENVDCSYSANTETDARIVPHRNSNGGRPQPSSWWRRFLWSSGLMLFNESIGFCLFQACQVSIGICYTAIMTFLLASAVYSGIDAQNAAFLITVLGIASLVVRLLVGWFIDLKLIKVDHMYVLAMVVFGGSALLTRASDAYGWYLFTAILFGASSGTFKTLVPVVLRSYVGVKNLAPAMGIFTVFTGLGEIVGPVLAGALYDASSSYNIPFFVIGSVLVATSFLLLLEPPLTRCKDRRQSKMADGHSRMENEREILERL